MNSWYRSRGSYCWRTLEQLRSPKVVITGGSNGLGRCIIEELIRKYDNVTVINIDVDIDSWQHESQVVNYKCDLGDSKQLDKVLQTINDTYREQINVIICNAGIRSKYSWFKDASLKEMERVFSINTWSAAKILQKLTPSYKPREGRQCYFVTISSVLGILAPSKVASYAASKAAVTVIHNSMSNDLQQQGLDNVRGLLVLPGQMGTSMFGGFNPPRTFWAPIVTPKALARDIIKYCNKGTRGAIRAPSYSYFAELLVGMPYIVQRFARWFSQMDNCLPLEETECTD